MSSCDGSAGVTATNSWTTASATIPVANCNRISKSQIVWDFTTNQSQGVVSGCDGNAISLVAGHPENNSLGKNDTVATLTVVLTSNSRVNSTRAGDLALFSGTQATAPWSASAGSMTIPVRSCASIGATTLYDMTAEAQVGNVTSCKSNMITVTSAAISSRTSGDLLVTLSSRVSQLNQKLLQTLWYNASLGVWDVTIQPLAR